MANRSLKAKMLKQKRRGKYRLHSGGDSVVVERDGPLRFSEDEHGNTKTLRRETITVRVERFSRQVVNQSENGTKRRNLYAEASTFLKEYHYNIKD